MRQKYFGTTFGFAGDNTVIPDPLQSGGQVSFNQGWTFDYQRDQTTDPAAKPIDRSTMNWLFGVITAQLQQYQQAAVPEWISATDNGGTPFPYEAGVRVRYSSNPGTVPFSVYVSIIANNTNTPNLADPTGATSKWQLAVYQIASTAQAAAGTDNSTIMTPSLVAQQDALRALLAGSSSQVFNVAPATASTHAPQAQQVQQNAFNYAGAAGGTANALTATLSPAPAAYTDDLCVIVRTTAANTGAVTLNVNGLGAISVVGAAHSALAGSELAANGFAAFAYSTALTKFILVWSTGGAEQLGAGSYGVTPATSDVSTKLATTQHTKNVSRQFSDKVTITSGITLDSSYLGKLTLFPASVTLPLSASLPNGAVLTLQCTSTAGSVSLSSGDRFVSQSNFLGTGALSMNYGDTLELLCLPGNSAWHVVGGTAALALQGPFVTGASFATNGYQKLPGGLLIQWGTWNPSATLGNPVAVTFPVAFPTLVRAISFGIPGQTSTSIQGAWADGISNSGFNGHSNQSASGVNYIAIGN